jgi:molybdenum cofactor biosynthesis enzyme MoaA
VSLTDKFGRVISDLRISITDRCNYKCVYCRTGNEGALYGDLPFEDYLRMARVLERRSRFRPGVGEVAPSAAKGRFFIERYRNG